MTDPAEKYEAVVVGCGPGGAAAAANLARNGVETLVLERGVDAGSKNVSGGLIYAEESAPYTIDGLFPGFREEATERPVTENYIHNVAGEKVKTFDIGDLHHHDTAWADSVLRRKMDSWLAQQVHERTRETGGGLLTEVHVTGLLRERGEIVGVTTEELDPIKADLIVAADGVNSELARDAGLMDWEEPEEWFQGVKAVVDVEPDVINERFDVDADDGAAHLFSGDLFDGVRGGGFLYTNESSLSIGTVFHLDSLAEEEAEPHELLDALLTHPFMGQWLEDDEYVYVDQTHVDMYGFDTEDDLLGETWRKLYDDDEVARLEEVAFPALEAEHRISQLPVIDAGSLADYLDRLVYLDSRRPVVLT